MIEDSLVGMQFGNWKVLEYAGSSKWLCECQCENHTRKVVAGNSLKRGASKSCGCLRKKILSEYKRNDLTGKTFGYWEAIEYSGNSMWKCKCNCGCNTIRDVRAQSLISGSSLSCGKYTTEFKDLKGKRFGKWLVLEYAGNSKWLCECQCINHTRRNVSRNNLTSGASQSCGCSKKLHNIIDITGQKFGELTVLSYEGEGNWLCKCSCGNYTIKNGQHIRRSSTISCGCKESKPISKEYILEAIKELTNKNGYIPFRDELRKQLNIGATTLARYIEKYNLQLEINHSFRSSYERDICNLIKSVGKKYISNSRKVIDNLELDIYIPENKMAIEVNGDYWHSALFKDKYYHQNKTIACAKQGIQLIHVFEHELNDVYTREKIFNLILNKLNSTNRRIIYARKTCIREIKDIDIIKDFLNKYHIQGYAASKINLGCFYNEELIGILSIGSPRFSNEYEYEIIRMCWKNDVAVIGGLEKIFKYFVNRFEPNNIVTYIDISKFTGNSYTRIGFKHTQINYITEPGYTWIKPSENIVLSRYQTQKHKLIEKGLGTEDQTEEEIMRDLGFYKVYDSGNLKLEWKRHNVKHYYIE